MKKYTLLIALSLILICGQASAEKINIVTTIGQITDVVKIIGGERVEVKGLMGAGVDPHLYKATESDVLKLAKADIIFYNGLYLEAKMEYIFKKMRRNTKVVAVGEATDNSQLLESVDYAGHYDPHIWFDVTLWKIVAQEIGDVLAQYDSDYANDYQKRTELYIEKLEKLHNYVKERSKELPADMRVLVTAHDAFRYFGNRYGYEVVGLQGLSTETEAGTKDVIELAKFIAQRKIKAIFVESSVPVRNIQAVQDAVNARGWDVAIGGELFSDAMGNEGSFEGTYIGMVTHNVDTIVNALK